ncbi:hypothetical protein [Meiothermus ruber]|uniref:hypothetical protein n=1 Tax=Meiothermus ruber TaxID=277 RepID=UPI00399355A6
MQPVERVWGLIDAVVANGQVQDEEELWAKVEARCAYLTNPARAYPELHPIHWWPGGC